MINHSVLKQLIIVVITTFTLLLAACTTSTNRLSSAPGFGGTGLAQLAVNEMGSGYGGTGHTSSGFGGTGIIGTITEFGSIWVNGIEIGYGDKTQLVSNLSNNDELKIGQQVILETLALDSKTLTKKIRIYYPVAGRVSKISDNGYIIDGEYIVHVDDKTLLDEGIAVEIGQYVAVNGFQNPDDSWTATRVNKNDSKLHFYKPTPTVKFSPNVSRIIVETTHTQLVKWVAANKLSLSKHSILNADNSNRVVLHADMAGSHLHNEQLNPYHSFISNILNQRSQIEQNMNQKGLLDMQRDQQELMQDMKQQQQMQMNFPNVPMNPSGNLPGNPMNPPF